MNYLIILLQVIFIGSAQAQTKPHKTLEQHSVSEINILFEETNQQIKQQEVVLELKKISKNLNGTLIYAKNKEILYEYSGGYKSLKNKSSTNNKIDSQSLFDLASLSKQFTAAAILRLISHDSLSLEEYITDFFPDLPYSNVKIKHLLTHTSGLPEYLDYESEFRTDTPFTNQMLLQYLTCDIPIMTATPEVEFQYVNTNYALLASVIEKITGQKFEDYIRANLFIPAGMTNSCFYTELTDIQKKDLCKGHLSDASEETDNILNSVLGDKSLYSTSEDLFKWYKSYYLDYRIISKRWVDKAISPQNRIQGLFPKEEYGYGLRIEENPYFGRLVYHGGLWRGFHHVMTYRPEDQTFILFLSNFRNRAHNGKTKLLFDIIDGA